MPLRGGAMQEDHAPVGGQYGEIVLGTRRFRWVS